MPAPEKSKRRFGFYLIGALLTAGLGLALMLPWADALGRLSYDLPFLFQSGQADEVRMIFINSRAKRDLGEAESPPLDRSYHTRLIERLHADGARLILFDFTAFIRPHPDPAVDEGFARAAHLHGRVVLLTRHAESTQMNAQLDQLFPILPKFTNAIAGWGLAEVDALRGQIVRRMHMGYDETPSVAWVAARVLGAAVTRDENSRLRERWLNYYGPPGTIQGVDYDHALETNGLPAGFFRDKIAVVCSGSEVGVAGAATDEFPNPWSQFGTRVSYGGEIQAQTVLNLLHGDWLEKIHPRTQALLFAAWGFLCAFSLSGRKPWQAALLMVGALLLIFASALWMQLKLQIWWSWMIPVVQTPVAFIWSVGYQYATESRRRRQLRRAFGAYLSPYMADQIADSEFDLALGGKEVEATVMFTDLEGFTQMSESLPPAEVSKILTSYFNQTTQAILEQDGTIIKYIGDAVMAVWGAPVPDPKHAERAVLAAWGMNQAGQKEIEGRRLRTRIGVNSGLVLAGNLGSDFRFDYTLIGDTTNFASRLEGLNKYLGTEILISEATRNQLSDRIKVRFLGRFIVVGKKTPVGICEVLGLSSSFPRDPEWLAVYADGLNSFVRRDLNEAARMMHKVKELRGGKDGPAEFYLGEIAKARESVVGEGTWEGTVRVDSK